MQHQRVGVVAPAGAERARHRRGDAAADGAGGEHLHHHEAGEDQRHAGQRIGAELGDPPGLDQPGRRPAPVITRMLGQAIRSRVGTIAPCSRRRVRGFIAWPGRRRSPAPRRSHRQLDGQAAHARTPRGARGAVAVAVAGAGRRGGQQTAPRAAGAFRRRADRPLAAHDRKCGSTSSLPLRRSTSIGSRGRAGRGVDQVRAAAALDREMPVAEGQQRHQHGAEIAAALRQQVLVARRPLAVAAPLEHAGRRPARRAGGSACSRRCRGSAGTRRTRVLPANASRRISMLHHSPTCSRLRAMGTAMSAKLLRCMASS